ncbi:hypothetical protein M0802_001521 [Mischocyttarus mexicanus]|nr:hypothetical protein M0802_001521 [Mischocyttarus mexicanus]
METEKEITKLNLNIKNENPNVFSHIFHNNEEEEEKENKDDDEETNSIKNQEKENRKDNDKEENTIYLTWDESSIFREEEEEYEFEKREESTTTTPRVSSTTMEKSKEDEKKEEEVRDLVEPDYVLAEIPAEVLNDREAMIDMMKGLISEMRPLRKRNKLLERRIYQHFQKIQKKVTTSEIESKTAEEIEQIYGEALQVYKLQIDEAIAKEMQFLLKIENYKDKVQTMKDEDERLFKELLLREKEIAVGLVYVKTGENISEKVVDVIANRQTVRRKVLARDRFENIALQHRFDRIDKLLQNLEVLGEGMTTMDYEALRMANVNHVDKLDERVRDLEKLRTLLAEMVNALAHLKEKEVCVVEDMEHERNKLTKSREDTTKVREQLNHFLVLLRDLREEYNHKRKEAGMLGIQPILREMDKATKLRNNLINDIERMKSELEEYRLATERKKKTASNLSSRTKSHINPSKRLDTKLDTPIYIEIRIRNIKLQNVLLIRQVKRQSSVTPFAYVKTGLIAETNNHHIPILGIDLPL